jgi:hypothetical protein
MEKHTIKLQELNEHILEYSDIYASSFGKGSNKQLRCKLSGGFEVWNNNEKVLETTQAYDAVSKYNSLR